MNDRSSAGDAKTSAKTVALAPSDRRPNKLTESERRRILDLATSPRFRDLSPKQIVPLLADEGVFVASESTFYRVLRAEKKLAHRGRAKPPTNRRPDELVATAPNQARRQ